MVAGHFCVENKAGVKLTKNTVVEIVGTRYNEQYKLELTELFRARDASCQKGKKMGERFRKIRIYMIGALTWKN